MTDRRLGRGLAIALLAAIVALPDARGQAGPESRYREQRLIPEDQKLSNTVIDDALAGQLGRPAAWMTRWTQPPGRDLSPEARAVVRLLHTERLTRKLLIQELRNPDEARATAAAHLDVGRHDIVKHLVVKAMARADAELAPQGAPLTALRILNGGGTGDFTRDLDLTAKAADAQRERAFLAALAEEARAFGLRVETPVDGDSRLGITLPQIEVTVFPHYIAPPQDARVASDPERFRIQYEAAVRAQAANPECYFGFGFETEVAGRTVQSKLSAGRTAGVTYAQEYGLPVADATGARGDVVFEARPLRGPEAVQRFLNDTWPHRVGDGYAACHVANDFFQAAGHLEHDPDLTKGPLKYAGRSLDELAAVKHRKPWKDLDAESKRELVKSAMGHWGVGLTDGRSEAAANRQADRMVESLDIAYAVFTDSSKRSPMSADGLGLSAQDCARHEQIAMIFLRQSAGHLGAHLASQMLNPPGLGDDAWRVFGCTAEEWRAMPESERVALRRHMDTTYQRCTSAEAMVNLLQVVHQLRLMDQPRNNPVGIQRGKVALRAMLAASEPGSTQRRIIQLAIRHAWQRILLEDPSRPHSERVAAWHLLQAVRTELDDIRQQSDSAREAEAHVRRTADALCRFAGLPPDDDPPPGGRRRPGDDGAPPGGRRPPRGGGGDDGRGPGGGGDDGRGPGGPGGMPDDPRRPPGSGGAGAVPGGPRPPADSGGAAATWSAAARETAEWMWKHTKDAYGFGDHDLPKNLKPDPFATRAAQRIADELVQLDNVNDVLQVVEMYQRGATSQEYGTFVLRNIFGRVHWVAAYGIQAWDAESQRQGTSADDEDHMAGWTALGKNAIFQALARLVPGAGQLKVIVDIEIGVVKVTVGWAMAGVDRDLVDALYTGEAGRLNDAMAGKWGGRLRDAGVQVLPEHLVTRETKNGQRVIVIDNAKLYESFFARWAAGGGYTLRPDEAARPPIRGPAGEFVRAHDQLVRAMATLALCTMPPGHRPARVDPKRAEADIAVAQRALQAVVRARAEPIVDDVIEQTAARSIGIWRKGGESIVQGVQDRLTADFVMGLYEYWNARFLAMGLDLRKALRGATLNDLRAMADKLAEPDSTPREQPRSYIELRFDGDVLSDTDLATMLFDASSPVPFTCEVVHEGLVPQNVGKYVYDIESRRPEPIDTERLEPGGLARHTILIHARDAKSGAAIADREVTLNVRLPQDVLAAMKKAVYVNVGLEGTFDTTGDRTGVGPNSFDFGIEGFRPGSQPDWISWSGPQLTVDRSVEESRNDEGDRRTFHQRLRLTYEPKTTSVSFDFEMTRDDNDVFQDRYTQADGHRYTVTTTHRQRYATQAEGVPLAGLTENTVTFVLRLDKGGDAISGVIARETTVHKAAPGVPGTSTRTGGEQGRLLQTASENPARVRITFWSQESGILDRLPGGR